MDRSLPIRPFPPPPPKRLSNGLLMLFLRLSGRPLGRGLGRRRSQYVLHGIQPFFQRREVLLADDVLFRGHGPRLHSLDVKHLSLWRAHHVNGLGVNIGVGRVPHPAHAAGKHLLGLGGLIPGHLHPVNIALGLRRRGLRRILGRGWIDPVRPLTDHLHIRIVLHDIASLPISWHGAMPRAMKGRGKFQARSAQNFFDFFQKSVDMLRNA
nr:MAG TPA: hypothetical protein [Caudoviricetes sp.]